MLAEGRHRREHKEKDLKKKGKYNEALGDFLEGEKGMHEVLQEIH